MKFSLCIERKKKVIEVMQCRGKSCLGVSLFLPNLVEKGNCM